MEIDSDRGQGNTADQELFFTKEEALYSEPDNERSVNASEINIDAPKALYSDLPS
jgi:hypothetical protein